MKNGVVFEQFTLNVPLELADVPPETIAPRVMLDAAVVLTLQVLLTTSDTVKVAIGNIGRRAHRKTTSDQSSNERTHD